jgi:hypothetical protein
MLILSGIYVFRPYLIDQQRDKLEAEGKGPSSSYATFTEDVAIEGRAGRSLDGQEGLPVQQPGASNQAST